MKKIFVLIIICAFGVHVMATNDKPVKIEKESINNMNTASINGIVLDKLTGEPLVGAEVNVIGSDVKVYTDFEGKFKLNNMEAGAHAIKVGLISYQQSVENVSAEQQNTNELVVKLRSVEK